jgi:hypothetical protein
MLFAENAHSPANSYTQYRPVQHSKLRSEYLYKQIIETNIPNRITARFLLVTSCNISWQYAILTKGFLDPSS